MPAVRVIVPEPIECTHTMSPASNVAFGTVTVPAEDMFMTSRVPLSAATSV